MTPEKMARWAAIAQSSDGAISAVAPRLDEQQIWRRIWLGAQEVDPDARSMVVGIACDGWRGEIGSEAEYLQAVADNFPTAGPAQVRAYQEQVTEIWTLLSDASAAGSDQDKATAALACFLAAEAVGLGD